MELGGEVCGVGIAKGEDAPGGEGSLLFQVGSSSPATNPVSVVMLDEIVVGISGAS